VVADTMRAASVDRSIGHNQAGQRGGSSSMTAEGRAEAIWRGCQALLRIAARAEQVAERTAAIDR